MTEDDPSARRRATDEAIRTLTRRQLGLFTRAQAVEAGLSSSALGRRVQAGQYEPRYPGVYALAGVPDSREHRYLAACLHLGDVWLAGPTAATLHGLEHGLPDRGIHLIAAGDRSVRRRTSMAVHRSRYLTEADTTTVGVLPVTDVTWTLTDLAAGVPPERLRSMVSRATQRRATNAARLREVLGRRRRLAGAAVLRAIVEELSPLEPRTRKELESQFLRLMTGAGCAPTAVNHPVRDAFGVRRELDAVWLPERVWVELDSEEFHGTPLDRHDDQRRANGLMLVGWPPPLRFTWADVTSRPHEVVRVVERALTLARAATASDLPAVAMLGSSHGWAAGG